MKKILTVSLFAMMAVSAANADIASTKYVDDIAKTKQASLGYTPENVANKIDTMPEKLADITDGQYPSAKAVYTYVSGEIGSVNTTNNTLSGRVDALEGAVTADGALQDVVGDAESGLVKDVADLETNKADKSYVNTELGKKQNNLSQTQMAAVNSGITTDKVTKYDGYDAKITAAKKAGDDAQATANSAVTVNTQQATAISGNTAAINTLKGDKTVTGSVAKSIDDAFTEANLSQYATTSTMNTELGKKQNNLSQTQMAAVNSGITTDKVTKYDGYDTKISQNKSAITANTTSINTINNSAVMNSGVTDKVVKSVETHTNDINTIKASDVMKSGVTADVVAKAISAMQETDLKALESWTTGQCAEPTVTCSLISKGGKIAWEVVTY